MAEVGRVADAAGEIDVLVNMAGFAALGSTADADEAAFDGLFQIDVKAPFFLVAALAPKIAARGGGAMFNISTMVARYGQLGMAAYGASRASIELLTKAWAAEYGPQNIPRQRGRSRSDVDPVGGAEVGDGQGVRQGASARPGRRRSRAVGRDHVPRHSGRQLHHRRDHPRRRRPQRDLRADEIVLVTSFDRRPDSVSPLVVGSGGRLRRLP